MTKKGGAHGTPFLLPSKALALLVSGFDHDQRFAIDLDAVRLARAPQLDRCLGLDGVCLIACGDHRQTTFGKCLLDVNGKLSRLLRQELAAGFLLNGLVDRGEIVDCTARGGVRLFCPRFRLGGRG